MEIYNSCFEDVSLTIYSFMTFIEITDRLKTINNKHEWISEVALKKDLENT